MTSDEAPRDPEEELLSELLDVYIERREGGRPVQLKGLLARAGRDRDRLLRLLDVYEMWQGMAAGIREGAGLSDTRVELEELGKFQITDTLGSGGSARVYLAQDEDTRRLVALKVLESTFLTRTERSFILNEARALALLNHPGVVRVYEVGQEDGRDYVSMEALLGPTLADVIALLQRRAEGLEDPSTYDRLMEVADRLGPLDERVRVLAHLASALHHCHDQRIIHRDVKPENIRFDARGIPKLIDFGNAHNADGEDDSLGMTRRLIVSPDYVAPEQLEQGAVGADTKSDQFAFGVFAYELLALRHPFAAGTQNDTQRAIQECAPPRLRRAAPAAAGDLELIVHTALARDPRDRYPGMRELAGDLEAVLAHRPLFVRPPSATRRLRLWMRRNRLAAALSAAVLAVLAAALVLQWGLGASERHRVLAQRLRGLAVDREMDLQERYDVGEGLVFLRSEISRHDVSLGARVFGRLGQELEDACLLWHQAVNSAYEDHLLLAREGGLNPQPGMFERLSFLASLVSPGAAIIDELQGRGLVTFPPEIADYEYEFYQQGTADHVAGTERAARYGKAISLYLPARELYSLKPGSFPFGEGSYRLSLWRAGADRLSFEVPILVPRGWFHEIRIELVGPDPDVLAEATLLPSAVFSDVAGLDLTLPSYFLTPLLTDLNSAGGPGDSRKAVSFEEALRYCMSRGMRLPSAAEVKHAFRQGVMEVHEGLYGEWVSDRADQGEGFSHYFLSYDDLKKGYAPALRGSPPHNALKIVEKGEERCVVFRMALTESPPSSKADR